MLRRMGTFLVPFSKRLYRLSLKPLGPVHEPSVLERNYQYNLLASYSQTMTAQVTFEMNLNYEDIIKSTGNQSIILIDVREPNELIENGILPSSVNIPLGDVKAALEAISPEEFKTKYGISLPDKDAPLVFSCKAGGRSKKALITALELGYKNAKHYAGGFLDWQSHTANV